MRFFKLLQKRSGFFYVYLVLLGLINTVWAGALLMLINSKISGSGLPVPVGAGNEWLVYSILIVLSFAVARYFQGYMIRLTYGLGNELGLSIFNKLRFANYEEYLKLGEDRVRTAMTDVTTLQRFPQAFIETFNAGVMTLIGIVYLFWLNPLGAGIISGVLVLLAVFYYIRNQAIHRDINTARDLANVYQQSVNDFLRGFKEIKMSMRRSDTIFNDHLTANRNRVKNLTIKTLTRFMVNELLGNYAWYLMIGIILFLLPVLMNMNTASSTGFIVTLLFLMGPVGIVVTQIKEFTNMEVAITRLGQFNKIINASDIIKTGHGDVTNINPAFESLRFENITYEYYDEKRKETFRLQPLNLEIKKGESVFITGGNGSGKSTFINILTGLYMPHGGSIYLNGHVITQENYPFYREQMTAIFTDNYLFGENYDGHAISKDNQQLQQLVEKMGLTDILVYDEEKNRFKASLSKGQQKRLALIYAMLENKDIIVLDEWAAEQDPVFRAFFYRKIIPELRKAGKTVIAVTHDDAYFDCAGRLIRFDYGQITSDVNLLETPSAKPAELMPA